MKLECVTVVVTGGARGIGFATARAIAARGARVAIGDLDGLEAEKAAASIGDHAMGLELDVTSMPSYVAFLTQVERRFGPPDVLVSNAGIMPLGAFAELSADLHRATVEVNLWGAILGARLVLPGMLERRRGRIVNVASLLGRHVAPGTATYCATKFGVIGFTKALREELVGTRVHVAAILPGAIKTDIATGVRHPGILTFEPEDVAAEIVRCCEKPSGEYTVPRWLDPLSRLLAALPQQIVRRTLGSFGYRAALRVDAAGRAAYVSRLNRTAARIRPSLPLDRDSQ